MKRIAADDGRFYSLADSQQEHLRADLSRTLHTPLHLPQYHHHHYGNFNGRHGHTHGIATLPCFSPHPVTSATPLLHPRYGITAPSSPDVLRKALATLCLSSRGTTKKRHSNNLRVTFADEIVVEGREVPVFASALERSPSPRSYQQPKSVLKPLLDNHSHIHRPRAQSFQDFGKIPEEEECFTDGGVPYSGSSPSSPNNPFSPTLTRSPTLTLSPLARPDGGGEREHRRALSDTDAMSCRKELFGTGEERHRVSTGSMDSIARPTFLDATHSTSNAVFLPTSREQQALQSLGPESNYATFPAARAYCHTQLSSVRDGSVTSGGSSQSLNGAHSQEQKPPSPAPSQESFMDHQAYLTFPPMNLSMYGWTKTFLKHDALNGDAQSVSSIKSEMCAEKGSSSGSVSLHSNPLCYTSGSSGGSWSHVMHPDPKGTQSPATGPSSLCDGVQGSSALGDRDVLNGNRSLPLPSVSDFMLQRYLGEVTRAFNPYSAPSQSSDNTLKANHHLNSTSHEPPTVLHPATTLPPDMRGKSVSYAPIGHYLMDMLTNNNINNFNNNNNNNNMNNNNSHLYGNPNQGSKLPAAYVSRFIDCTSLASLEDSWRALTDMVRYQSQFYAPGEPHSNGNTPSPPSDYPLSTHSSDLGCGTISAGSEARHSSYNGNGSTVAKIIISKPEECGGLNNNNNNNNNNGYAHNANEGVEFMKVPERPDYACSEPGDAQDVAQLKDLLDRESRPRSFSNIEHSLCRNSCGPGCHTQRTQAATLTVNGHSINADHAAVNGNKAQEGLNRVNKAGSMSWPQNLTAQAQSFQDERSKSLSCQDLGSLQQGSGSGDTRPRSSSYISASHLIGRSGEGQKSVPRVPLQSGSSEEMAADFLLFCAAVKAAFVPPHAVSKPPPGPPFPDFNPNWFRFLPGFPK